MEASAAVEAWGPAPERRRADVFLPLVVFPRERGAALEASAAELRGVIRRYLPREGAILFRGFRVGEDADFERFVAAAAEPERGASVAGRVWAWCAVPARGQRVLLADRRELYRAVPGGIRRRWAERALAYELRDERGRPIASRRVAPVVLHPQTREPLWAQLEHHACAGAFGDLLGLARATGEARGLGRAERWTVEHGDGSPLDELDVYEVNAAVDACRSELSLEARDVLLLDPSRIMRATLLGADAGITVRRECGARSEESSAP